MSPTEKEDSIIAGNIKIQIRGILWGAATIRDRNTGEPAPGLYIVLETENVGKIMAFISVTREDWADNHKTMSGLLDMDDAQKLMGSGTA